MVKPNEAVSDMDGGGCQPPSIPLPKDDWMEMEVIMGFRIWQLMFLALAGLITVVVLLCCFMKCRVPRTKQEIEADFKRKEITRRFRFLLDRVQVEDTSLRTAIEKVNELYNNREKTKKRKKKKPDEEEEIVSIDSSYLFEDEKLTLIQKIKKILGLIKEEDSDDDEDDSQKDKSEKSEDIIKRASDDEQSSPPNKESLPAKTRQLSEESKESTDSPKLADSYSKLSLIPDSPTKTHDTLSRLSFLQDSPPNNGISLLQDTPPEMRKLSKGESGTTDSHDSKQKTTSQESQDSESSTKKQDSQDSDKSPQPKLGSTKFSKGKLKKASSDSQDSEDSHLIKQKSDSQDSNDSETPTKNKKNFETRDSKLIRRESIGGGRNAQDFIHKWQQRSPLMKSKMSRKGSKSLDVSPAPH